MRPILLLLALGLSPVSPAAAYSAAAEAGPDPIRAQLAVGGNTFSFVRPACTIRTFTFDEAPEESSRIEQITCLDAMCTLREIVFCTAAD